MPYGPCYLGRHSVLKHCKLIKLTHQIGHLLNKIIIFSNANDIKNENFHTSLVLAEIASTFWKVYWCVANALRQSQPLIACSTCENLFLWNRDTGKQRHMCVGRCWTDMTKKRDYVNRHVTSRHPAVKTQMSSRDIYCHGEVILI